MPDRLPVSARQPAVARALRSPTGLLLAAGGALIGLVAGGGILLAAILAVAGWSARVVAAVLRHPGRERIDPFTLQDPWRTMVRRAQSTSVRFQDAVGTAKPGPLRERLTVIGRRVDDAVIEAWAIAKRGHALDKAVSELDVARIRLQLEGPIGADPVAAQAVRNQLQSAERLAAVAADARTGLQRLNAELDEAVARAVELSMSAVDAGALQPLGSELDNVVDELESLRLALDETT